MSSANQRLTRKAKRPAVSRVWILPRNALLMCVCVCVCVCLQFEAFLQLAVRGLQRPDDRRSVSAGIIEGI